MQQAHDSIAAACCLTAARDGQKAAEAYHVPVHKGLLVEAQGEVALGIVTFELDSCNVMGTCCVDLMVKGIKTYLIALMPQMCLPPS